MANHDTWTFGIWQQERSGRGYALADDGRVFRCTSVAEADAEIRRRGLVPSTDYRPGERTGYACHVPPEVRS